MWGGIRVPEMLDLTWCLWTFFNIETQWIQFHGVGDGKGHDLNDEDLMIQFSGVKICRRFGDISTPKAFWIWKSALTGCRWDSFRGSCEATKWRYVRSMGPGTCWYMYTLNYLRVHHAVVGIYIYMGVSENSGTPKSSILIGFFIINHPFWGTTIFGNTHIYIYIYMLIQYIVVFSIWW